MMHIPCIIYENILVIFIECLKIFRGNTKDIAIVTTNLHISSKYSEMLFLTKVQYHQEDNIQKLYKLKIEN